MINEAIEFAKQINPIWPFAALIVDEDGNVLCKATDCAQISPLFHAETLAIHALVTNIGYRKYESLTLYTTAEPDPMSQSAIHWGNVVHDLAIKRVCFGSSLKTIQQLL